MKENIKKILKVTGVWNLLAKGYFTLVWWDARKFAPIFGENRFVAKYRHKSKKYKDLSHSQYGQELYIYENIFHEMKKGTFVEIGGNDPIVLSNSYTFEKLGWTGLSFEPIDELRQKWQGLRKTKCYPYLIGDKEGYVEFEEKSGDLSVMSSVVGYGRDNSEYKIVKKEMRKLENVLSENKINSVDILFVDVEGFEMNVIKGIDFNKVSITCICVENPCFTKEGKMLRKFLCDKGYLLKAHIGSDDIFVLANTINIKK